MTTQKNTRKIREEVPNIAMIEPCSVFNNYGALCLALGVSAVQGNVKTAQLKEWKRYFEFEIIPGTYMIKIISIYPSTQPKEASNRKSIYLKDMKLLLLSLIANRDNEAGLIIPKSQLPVALGLCNDSYLKYKYNLYPMVESNYYKFNPRKNNYIAANNLDEFDVPIEIDFELWFEQLDYEDFLQKSSNVMNGWIKSLLINLKTSGLITIEETYLISYINDSSSKEAIPEIKAKIDAVRDKFLPKYDVKNKNLYLIYYCGRYKKFITDVNEVLLTLGIKKHSKAYKFSFTSGLENSYRTGLAEGMQASERVNANSMARFSSTNKEKEIAEILIKKT